MKNHVKHFAIIAFVAVIGLGFLSCEIVTSGSGLAQKKIAIYEIPSQYIGMIGELVLDTNKAYARETIGGTSHIFFLLDSDFGGAFTGSGYSIKFQIYEKQANGTVGTLQWDGTAIKTIVGETTTISFTDFSQSVASIPYIITSSGGSFSATKSGSTFSGQTGTIETVLTSIRTHANENDITIQFGNGTSALDIQGNRVEIKNPTGGSWVDKEWGNVTISGKITANTTGASPVAVIFDEGVWGSSRADITQNSTNTGAIALQKKGAGTLAITGGTVAGITAVSVDTNSTVTVSGGTIRGTGSSGTAITSYGKIILSGTPTITSANTLTNGGTICLLGGPSVGYALTVEQGVILTNTATTGPKNKVYIDPTASPHPTCGGSGWPLM